GAAAGRRTQDAGRGRGARGAAPAWSAESVDRMQARDPAAAAFYAEDAKDLDFFDFEPLPTVPEDEPTGVPVRGPAQPQAQNLRHVLGFCSAWARAHRATGHLSGSTPRPCPSPSAGEAVPGVLPRGPCLSRPQGPAESLEPPAGRCRLRPWPGRQPCPWKACAAGHRPSARRLAGGCPPLGELTPQQGGDRGREGAVREASGWPAGSAPGHLAPGVRRGEPGGGEQACGRPLTDGERQAASSPRLHTPSTLLSQSWGTAAAALHPAPPASRPPPAPPPPQAPQDRGPSWAPPHVSLPAAEAGSERPRGRERVAAAAGSSARGGPRPGTDSPWGPQLSAVSQENVSLADVLSLRGSGLGEQEAWAVCLECSLSLRSVAPAALFQTLCVSPDTLAFSTSGSVCFMEQLSGEAAGSAGGREGTAASQGLLLGRAARLSPLRREGPRPAPTLVPAPASPHGGGLEAAAGRGEPGGPARSRLTRRFSPAAPGAVQTLPLEPASTVTIHVASLCARPWDDPEGAFVPPEFDDTGNTFEVSAAGGLWLPKPLPSSEDDSEAGERTRHGPAWVLGPGHGPRRPDGAQRGAARHQRAPAEEGAGPAPLTRPGSRRESGLQEPQPLTEEQPLPSICAEKPLGLAGVGLVGGVCRRGRGPGRGGRGPPGGALASGWGALTRSPAQAHIYSLGATLKAALEYPAGPEPGPKLSQDLEALLSQMQAEDPGARPALQVAPHPQPRGRAALAWAALSLVEEKALLLLSVVALCEQKMQLASSRRLCRSLSAVGRRVLSIESFGAFPGERPPRAPDLAPAQLLAPAQAPQAARGRLRAPWGSAGAPGAPQEGALRAENGPTRASRAAHGACAREGACARQGGRLGTGPSSALLSHLWGADLRSWGLLGWWESGTDVTESAWRGRPRRQPGDPADPPITGAPLTPEPPGPEHPGTPPAKPLLSAPVRNGESCSLGQLAGLLLDVPRSWGGLEPDLPERGHLRKVQSFPRLPPAGPEASARCLPRPSARDLLPTSESPSADARKGPLDRSRGLSGAKALPKPRLRPEQGPEPRRDGVPGLASPCRTCCASWAGPSRSTSCGPCPTPASVPCARSASTQVMRPPRAPTPAPHPLPPPSWPTPAPHSHPLPRPAPPGHRPRQLTRLPPQPTWVPTPCWWPRTGPCASHRPPPTVRAPDSFFLAPEAAEQKPVTEKASVYCVAAVLWTAAKFSVPRDHKLALPRRLKALLLDMARRRAAERPSVAEASKRVPPAARHGQQEDPGPPEGVHLPGFPRAGGDTRLVAVQGPVPGPPRSRTGASELPPTLAAATHFTPVTLPARAAVARWVPAEPLPCRAWAPSEPCPLSRRDKPALPSGPAASPESEQPAPAAEPLQGLAPREPSRGHPPASAPASPPALEAQVLGPAPPGASAGGLRPLAKPPGALATEHRGQESASTRSALRGPALAAAGPESPGGTAAQEQGDQTPDGHPERPQPADPMFCPPSVDAPPVPGRAACPSLQEAMRLIQEEFAFDGYLDNGLEALIMGEHILALRDLTFATFCGAVSEKFSDLYWGEKLLCNLFAAVNRRDSAPEGAPGPAPAALEADTEELSGGNLEVGFRPQKSLRAGREQQAEAPRQAGLSPEAVARPARREEGSLAGLPSGSPGWGSAFYEEACFGADVHSYAQQMAGQQALDADARSPELEQQLVIEKRNYRKTLKFYQKLLQKEKRNKGSEVKTMLSKLKGQLEETQAKVQLLGLPRLWSPGPRPGRPSLARGYSPASPQVLYAERWGLEPCALPDIVNMAAAQCDTLAFSPLDESSSLIFYNVSKPARGGRQRKGRVLQAGTPLGLMAYLYSSDAFLEGYVQQFLYTFRYFCTPQDFLRFLLDRISGTLSRAPQDPTSGKIYRRSFCLLQAWVEDCLSVDFARNAGLLGSLEDFISSKVTAGRPHPQGPRGSCDSPAPAQILPLDGAAEHLLGLLEAGGDRRAEGAPCGVDAEDPGVEEETRPLSALCKRLSEDGGSWKSFPWRLSRGSGPAVPQAKERQYSIAAALPRPCFLEDMHGPPIKASEKGPYFLTEYSAHQLFTQLTLLQQELFQKCHPVHFLNSRALGVTDRNMALPRAGPADGPAAPAGSLFLPSYVQDRYLLQLLRSADDISTWVAAEIISSPNTKLPRPPRAFLENQGPPQLQGRRASPGPSWAAPAECAALQLQVNLLSKFLLIAKSCYEHRNFATAMQILWGLEHTAVRQSPAWRILPAKMAEIMEELKAVEVFLKSDSLCLMEGRRSRAQPTLPSARLLAMHVQQLETGGFTMTNGAHRWSKLRNIARVVSQVPAFQESPYTFPADPKLQAHLRRRVARFSGADVALLAADSRPGGPAGGSGKPARKIQDKLRRMRATFQ
ncbi:LOW QUALITY PROTEIN: Kinase non-catalytic C-lobe domain-containing protein 1, partial [Galemys pyrenaicus]